MSININIPKEVEKALYILNENGYEAYVVGGCVRDSILGKIPNDWDITTSAKPNEISQCFINYKTINTGLKHGTVTVIIDRKQLEITTYRIDGEYKDNRHPESVLFTNDVSDDLKRRDFTINALAYNKEGLVDLFYGVRDIEEKLIKCVGEPNERFNEDGLRILRALRFSSVLGFNIEKNTSKSIYKNKNLLSNISKERIINEFNKLITGNNFYNIMFDYKEVIEVFIKELYKLDNKMWIDILNSMCYVDSLVLRLSLLLYKTNESDKILKNLKYDNATIKGVLGIASNYNEQINPNKKQIKHQLKRIGSEDYINLLKFKCAVFKSQNQEQEIINIKETEKLVNEIINNNECYNLKMLAINGEDLIKLGFSKGIILGSILNEVLDLVIEEKLENKKEILAEYVSNLNVLK